MELQIQIPCQCKTYMKGKNLKKKGQIIHLGPVINTRSNANRGFTQAVGLTYSL